MKTKIITALFVIFSQAANAQSATAYQWYYINKNLGNTDAYIFTSTKSFTYPKGSSYAFAPISIEKLAQRSVETALENIDASSNGLYVNQISNAARTSFKDEDATMEEIKDQMDKLYRSKQQAFRGSDIKIVLIDISDGEIISEYSLAASKSNYKSGAGNAN
jgi:hypothetical protein